MNNCKNKKVAIVQSNYIPWKGYFDMINMVDEFILYDNAQYTKRDWRNRNIIKTENGLKWLTIPVNVKGRYLQSIKDVRIVNNEWANLIIATGTKRDGFHLSPVISEALVSILLNKKVDKRFEFFKPERKLIHLLSREQAIKKSVSHLMSASYQHGFNPGYISINNNLKSQFKDDLERLHDKVGAFDWGIPTEMIDMYRHDHINYK